VLPQLQYDSSLLLLQDTVVVGNQVL